MPFTMYDLKIALQKATEAGLLDELCGYLHPDRINDFCDAVSDAERFVSRSVYEKARPAA